MHTFDQYGFTLIARSPSAITLLDTFVAIGPEKSESRNWEVWKTDVDGIEPGLRPSVDNYIPTDKLFEFNLPGSISEECAYAVITALEHAFELGRKDGAAEMAKAQSWALECMLGKRDPEQLLDAASAILDSE